MDIIFKTEYVIKLVPMNCDRSFCEISVVVFNFPNLIIFSFYIILSEQMSPIITTVVSVSDLRPLSLGQTSD